MKSLSATALAGVVLLYGSAAMAQVGSAFISPRATSLVTIAATPSAASVPYGFTQQFTATIAGTTNTGVNWTVNGVNGGNNKSGTISTAGLYTAPTLHGNSMPSSVTVAAVSNADPTKSASAIVTFTTGVSVAITPSSASVQVGAIQQFTAVVKGTSNTAVSWTVNGVSGGNSIVGTISASGLYTAPATAPASAVIIAAVSAIDPSKSAQATVTVLSGVLVSISPITASVPVGQTQLFAATITGTANTVVTWKVNGSTGGNSTYGTISSSGLYTAPSTVPTETVAVVAISAADPTKSAQAVVTVLSALAITTAALPGGIVGSSYSATLAAAGGVAPYNWSISSGLLPSGCSLTTTSGIISGTPTAAGSYNVVMNATDSAGQQSSKGFSIVIAAALAISTTMLPSGTAGVAYSATLSAAGGTPPYTWSLASGQLAPGISLTSSGTISGTPSTAGSYNFVAQVVDGAAHQTSKSLSLVVWGAPVITITTSLPNGTTGVAYSATLAATGGTAPYTWSITLGQLPTGLNLDSATGMISGTPTSAASYAFTATVTDSASPQNAASKQLALTVVGALDSYGGRSDLKCAGGAKTRFYSERIGSRMWLCTPAGNAMWAQGVYAVVPQGNLIAKYASSSNAYEQTLARLKSWGFNFLHTYTDANLMPWNRTTKMPAISLVRPGFYGMSASRRPNDPFPPGTLNQNIKDLMSGMSPYLTGFISANGIADWGDLTRMNTSLTYLLTQTQLTDPLGLAPAIQGNKSLDFLIGVAVEDSDQTWGYWTSGQNDPFDTQPTGKGAPHGGYLTAIMSPVQQADAREVTLYATDQTVYAKKVWHDFLVTKYATIATLNTAWGSNYTSFDSTATAVKGESLATTNGTAFAFSKTLANAGTLVPNSLRVYQDGVMIAGDCFHPGLGDTCNPTTGTIWGAVWGQTASGGTVNYSNKAITVAYSGLYQFLDSISCSTTAPVQCTGNIVDYEDAALGVIVGNTISVRGSTCCNSSIETVTNKTGPVATLYTYTWTNNTAVNGSETWAGGARDQMAKVTPPAAGKILTVDYAVNGWNAGGTGLMDEEGRPAHTWMGSDQNALTTANANVAADLRAFLYQLAHDYFSAMRTGVRSAFTNATLTPPMYLGPDALGTWTATPRKEVLQAAAGIVDLAIMGGAAGYTLTQPMLDFMAQWYGGPFLDGVFLHSNADSPFLSSKPDSDYATQAARGAAYQSTVTSYLSSTTTSGVNPRVGFGWWQHGDNSSEGTNWGLVTIKDNAYDGHEAVTGSVTCSAPLQGISCGGEAGNYGDVITSVKSANSLWRIP